MKRRRKKPVQLGLHARTWGGARKKAGRPRTTGWVVRKPRPEFPRRFPLHVTLKVRKDVGSLRTEKCFAKIQRAFFYGHDRFGMRMVEFSVQGNHIHLVVEAENRRALARGIQGLSIRLARAVNRVFSRHGKVFADRYHARILKTPTEVRHVVEYVRHNQKKHFERAGKDVHPFYIDPYSSMSGEACWYMHDYDWGALVVARANTWLLRSHLEAVGAGSGERARE